MNFLRLSFEAREEELLFDKNYPYCTVQKQGIND